MLYMLNIKTYGVKKCSLKDIHINKFYFEKKISNFKINSLDLMSGNTQHIMCSNAECQNQRLNIKYCLKECSYWRDSIKSTISLITWKTYWEKL